MKTYKDRKGIVRAVKCACNHVPKIDPVNDKRGARYLPFSKHYFCWCEKCGFYFYYTTKGAKP